MHGGVNHHATSVAVAAVCVVWSVCVLFAGPARLPQAVPPMRSGVPGERSVRDGVFTAEQAARGRKAFQTACGSCHTVAERTGRRFIAGWRDSSVGDLFDLLFNTMPANQPGSLKPEEYTDIIAFLLQESGYPDGEQELPATLDELAKVRFESPGPD